MSETPSILDVMFVNNTHALQQDIRKPTVSLDEKSKMKRVIRKIDFKELQQAGLDRKIAEAIYQQQVHSSKEATTSPLTGCFLSVLSNDSHKSQSHQCNTQIESHKTKDLFDTLSDGNNVMNKQLVTNVLTSKECIHLKPFGDEFQSKNLNSEKKEEPTIKSENFIKQDIESCSKKTKLEATDTHLNKHQIVIPKASIKPSNNQIAGETSRKISKNNFSVHSKTKLSKQYVTVSYDNETIDLTLTEPTKSAGVRECLQKVSTKIKQNNRKPSTNAKSKSNVKSLIVLENKVLSEKEIIDLAALRFATNEESCRSAIPLNKSLKEIKEEVTNANTKMNECDENVNTKSEESKHIKNVKSGEILNEVSILNITKSDNSISSTEKSTPKNIHDNVLISPIPIDYTHTKSVQIINEPRPNDTFSAVDFLASLDTSELVNETSPIVLSLEELNLSASLRQNVSTMEIKKLHNSTSTEITPSNFEVKVGEIVTIDEKDVVPLGDNKMCTIIIPDDNEPAITTSTENITISPLPTVSSSVSLGQNVSTMEIKKLHNSISTEITPSNFEVKVGKIVTIDQKDVVPLGDNKMCTIIIPDDNKPAITTSTENITISPLPTVSSSVCIDNLQVLSMPPVNCISDICKKKVDSCSEELSNKKRLLSDYECNQNIVEVLHTKKIGIMEENKCSTLLDLTKIENADKQKNGNKQQILELDSNPCVVETTNFSPKEQNVIPKLEVSEEKNLLITTKNVFPENNTTKIGKVSMASSMTNNPSMQNKTDITSSKKVTDVASLKRTKESENDKGNKKSKKINNKQETELCILDENAYSNEIMSKSFNESIKSGTSNFNFTEELIKKNETLQITTNVINSEYVNDQSMPLQTDTTLPEIVIQSKKTKIPKTHLSSLKRKTKNFTKKRDAEEKSKTVNLFEKCELDEKLPKELTKSEKQFKKLKKGVDTHIEDKTESKINNLCAEDVSLKEFKKTEKSSKNLVEKVASKRNKISNHKNDANNFPKQIVGDSPEERCSKRKRDNNYLPMKTEVESLLKYSFEISNQSSTAVENCNTKIPIIDDDDEDEDFLGFEEIDQSVSEVPEVIFLKNDENVCVNKKVDKQKDITFNQHFSSWLKDFDSNKSKNKKQGLFNNNLYIPLKKRRNLSGNTFSVENVDKDEVADVSLAFKTKKSETIKHIHKEKVMSTEKRTAQTRNISVTQSDQKQETNINKEAPSNGITPKLVKKRGRVRKSVVGFNPRLLLITEREQLNTDTKLTEHLDETSFIVGSSANVQCGLCLKYIDSPNMWISHLSEHYGIGWKVGEAALDVNCRSSVLSSIITYYKDTRIKGLPCRMCKKIFRSALGLLSHIEICGLSTEKAECDYCKRKYAKHYLVSHMRSCSAVTQLSKTTDDISGDSEQCQSAEKLEVFGSTGRVKRVSTIKAETKLKVINAQLTKEATEEDIKAHINYVKPDIENYMAKWQSDINLFGKGFCPQKICKFYSTKLIELEQHVKTCKYIEQPGYYCKLCKTCYFDTIDLVIKHIQQKHQERSGNSDNSECSVNTDDEESTDNDDDSVDVYESDNNENDDVANEIDNDGKKKTRNKSKRKRKIGKADKIISKPISNNIILTKKGFVVHCASETLLDKWQTFLKLNYSYVSIFPNFLVQYILKQSTDVIQYLPKQSRSMRFTISENSNFCNNVDKSRSVASTMKWLQLKRFESLNVNDDEVFFFCGAPIKALYWLPLPNNINEQYLVVICRKDLYQYTRLKEPKRIRSTIVIFKVNQSTSGSVKYPEIQLHYVIYMEDGPIHDISFLPSGGYDKQNNRLGLMAVANISNIIKIYALPINFNNSNKKNETSKNDVIILELKSVFQLQLNINSAMDNANEQHKYKTQCLKICWSEVAGHKHIFAGFSNGFLGIWDITENENNLNRFTVNNTIVFVPINYWYTGENCVKQLDVHYDTNGPRWLLAAGKFRRYIIYDIRDFMQPIIVKCDGLNSIICKLHWPVIFETFLLGASDIIAYQGRCLYAVNPAGTNFSHNKLDNMLSGVTSIHYTPLMNLYVCGTANGDMVILHSRKLPMNFPDKKNLSIQRVISTTDVKSFMDDEINMDNDVTITHNTSSSNDFQIFGAFYKEKYGLIYDKNLFKLTASQNKLYLNEKRRPPFSILPYKRISSVRCNLNTQAQELIAFGYDNGFVRVINFNQKRYFN